MSNNESNNINLLPEYLFRGQYERTDQLNTRILERNVPDNPLPPNFTPRSVLTKYSLFPMLDSRMPQTLPIQDNYNYSLSNNFTPPLMKSGPVSGIINNIQLESELRNQIYAINKGNDESVYVPSSDSDLYKVYITSNQVKQPYPELFKKQEFSKQLHPNVQDNKIGRDLFHNNTRTQRKTIITNNI